MKIWEIDFTNGIWYYCKNDNKYYRTKNGELFDEDGENITDNFTLDRFKKIELIEGEPVKDVSLSPSDADTILECLKNKRDNSCGIDENLYTLIERFERIWMKY